MPQPPPPPPPRLSMVPPTTAAPATEMPPLVTPATAAATPTGPSGPSHDVMDEKRSSNTANTLFPGHESYRATSPAEARDQGTALYDEVELQRAERLVSTREQHLGAHKTRAPAQEDSDNDDGFAPAPKTKTRAAEPSKDNGSHFYHMLLRLRKFPRFIRYFLYLLPGAAILLAPILLDKLAFEPGTTPVGGPGGVDLLWFGIWLEIVWCTLWATRIVTSVLPYLFKGVARMFGSNSARKWKDIGHHLELHVSLFLWMLSILVSFLPIVNSHRIPTKVEDPDVTWIHVLNKIIISLFVLASLNAVEKILVQWITVSFHSRTYARRIEQNKSDIATLVRLYEFSKMRLPDVDVMDSMGGTGTKTPMQAFSENARQAWTKVGGFANKVGNDFIGRKVAVNHPKKVVQELIKNTKSAHTLARIVFRALRADMSKETVYLEDIQQVFDDEEEAELAFGVFDKDLNGDISMDEFEGVCNEIHLEKKAISASMKDLDSVIKKLDSVFMVVVFIISIIVFVSIISGSAAAALGSAGTTILGLAWMLQATAQEFLQSIIFVFVKHPFDVGDRVTIYGNVGVLGRGDDYYITEVSLLYTEFKKMEGHIVQAPNSTLNTLFILNHRRSNGLANPVSLQVRFGTTEEQIEELKARMLDFCLENKRDYHSRILSEIKTLDEMRSATMNIVFFHKSSFQNELLRLSRHNRFLTELMRQMVDLGIQAPFRNEPGGSREHPVFWQGAAPPAYSSTDARPEHQYPHSAGVDDLTRKFSTATSTRYRAEPRVSDLVEEPYMDFQDVYSSRREPNMNRIRSVRENSISMHPEFHAHSPTLDRSGTVQSNATGRRFWSRNRAGSRAAPPQPGVSGDFVHANSPTLDRSGTVQSNATGRRFWSRNRSGSRAPPPQPGASAEFV